MTAPVLYWPSVGGVESGVGRLIDDRGEEAREVTLLVLATLPFPPDIPENQKRYNYQGVLLMP